MNLPPLTLLDIHRYSHHLWLHDCLLCLQYSVLATFPSFGISWASLPVAHCTHSRSWHRSPGILDPGAGWGKPGLPQPKKWRLVVWFVNVSCTHREWLLSAPLFFQGCKYRFFPLKVWATMMCWDVWTSPSSLLFAIFLWIQYAFIFSSMWSSPLIPGLQISWSFHCLCWGTLVE